MPILSRLVNKISGRFKEKSFGLNRLDWKLKSHLNFDKGFFVEVGANDGISQSNTLYFEKYKNWKGLLIEAIPELAEKCRINRPKCIVENCALVPFDFQETTIEMTYCHLMSIVRGAMETQLEEENHIKRGSRIQNLNPYLLRVPVQTLSAVLDHYAIKTINLLSLDVEGFELSVLKGLDFNKHRPTYMLIEVRNQHEIGQFLKGRYEPIAELSHCETYSDILYRLKRI